MHKALWAKHTNLASLLGLALLTCVVAHGQDGDSLKPVPILTGSAGFSTQVNAGEVENIPSVTPLLLIPLGDKWLVEAKGSYSDTIASKGDGDDDSSAYGSSYGMSYAQIDYLANRFVTVTAGRFITPFGVYSERQFPDWVRTLPITPLTVPLSSNSSLGGMLRGGFTIVPKKVNLNYATYFSANNTNHILATQRATGGRIGFFLPGPRLEIGASFQQILQSDHSHLVGLHGEWQPNTVPLTLRSEFAHSSGTRGTAYWVESAYRLKQIPYLRQLELTARGQQFLVAPDLTPTQVTNLGSLGLDTNQGDLGLNYYLNRDIRASASYGRQFIAGEDANIWVAKITYRFITPLGFTGNAQ